MIRGTRIPVAIVTASVAGGVSLEDAAWEYDIHIDDVRAAIAYATALVDAERHYPLAG